MNPNLKIYVMTTVRIDAPVWWLQEAAELGDPTPISGNAIARSRMV